MKKLLILSLIASLTGCGYINRTISGYTGQATETCESGVLYLQFTTGTSVKYLRDGKVATCN